MRIVHAVVVAGTLAAIMFGATVAARADETPPSTLKCKAPKVPTQVTVKGKMTWKCVAPPPAALSPPPPPAPTSMPDASAPREPTH